MRDAEVTQEPSDFDSVIDLEKVILSHNDKEFGKPNKRMSK